MLKNIFQDIFHDSPLAQILQGWEKSVYEVSWRPGVGSKPCCWHLPKRQQNQCSMEMPESQKIGIHWDKKPQHFGFKNLSQETAPKSIVFVDCLTKQNPRNPPMEVRGVLNYSTAQHPDSFWRIQNRHTTCISSFKYLCLRQAENTGKVD